ncbi:MAG: hypothetical protein HY287_09950 [Planctomycetes bacterium]|nr:hypothetical protein [Planctomycetota bacterium]MBI3834637.1 hypothetical protein [Planctomycetota bacterium]
MTWEDEVEYNNAGLDEWIVDDSPDDVLLHCPSCKREVHEDTQQCPHCGDWITPVDLSDRPKRRIWLVAVIFLILAFTGAAVLVQFAGGAARRDRDHNSSPRTH